MQPSQPAVSQPERPRGSYPGGKKFLCNFSHSDNFLLILISAQPPTIVADEADITAEEGSYATLKCTIRGSPTPVITWKKDNTIVSLQKGKMINSFITFVD